MSIINLINEILGFYGLKLIRKKTNYDKKLELYKKLIIASTTNIDNSIGCIIFSLDRATQLDALLRSFFLNKVGACNVIVIYKASTEQHKNTYIDVINRHKGKVLFINEQPTGFKRTLINALENLDVGKIFFLVDDIIFIRQVDFDLLSTIDTTKYIFSLRMGKHLDYSYVVGKTQKLPNFIDKDEQYIYWIWEEAEFDWAYPLSVDGHIFNKTEIQALAKHFDYKAPNSFEEILQQEKHIFSHRLGMGYKEARIVNNPCNKVQNEVPNFHGSIHQDDLLNIWQNGKEIDIQSLQGYINKSVHENIKFKFKERV